MPTSTWVNSEVPLPSQPVDAGGGAPGNYGQQVLDLFKFGIGAWQSNKVQQNELDYRRWETTMGITSQQGQPSVTVVPTGSGGVSTTTMLAIAGGLLVVLLVMRRAR